MKKSKASSFLTLALGLVLGLSAAVSAFAFIPETTVAEAKSAVIATEISADFAYGKTVTFPSTVEVTYDGKTFTGEKGVIICPDDTVRSIDGGVVLDQKGGFTLRYYFTVDGVRRSAEKEFTVGESYFALSADNGSTISVPDAEHKLYTYQNKSQGLMVNLVEGCEFKYNKPVNLAAANGEGACEGLTEILTLDPRFGERDTFAPVDRPGEPGYYLTKAYAKTCVIRLTDCYDSSVYVEIRMYLDYADTGLRGHVVGTTYYRACSSTQENVGIEFTETWQPDPVNRRLEVFYEGKRGIAYYNQNLGTVGCAMVKDDTYQPNNGVKFWYDFDRDRIFFTADEKNSQQFDNPKLVNDLTSTDIYSADNLFKGFTTGEVFVSLYVENYISTSARVDVISIGETGGAELTTEVNRNDYVEADAPVIVVDAKATDSNGVYAAVGDKFVIPSAKAYDVNLKGDVAVNVYRKYGTSNQIDVSVENGVFDIKYADKYFIVYTAKDANGTVGKSVFVVNPLRGSGSSDAGKLTVKKAIDFSVNKLSAFTAGSTVTLPEYTATTANLSDELEVSVDVTVDGQSVTLNNGAFIPVKAGTYKFTYTMRDNAVEYTASYEVVCAPNDNAGFVDKPTLPRYFIKGASYDIPALNGYSFGETLEFAEVAKTAISFDGSAYTELSSLAAVKIEADSTVKLKYTLTSGAVYETENIPVADVHYGEGTLKLHEYFRGDFSVDEKIQVSDGGTVMEVDNPEVTFNSNVRSGSNKLEFINTILYTNLAFEFQTPKTKAKYDNIDLIFTDIYDENVKLVVSFINSQNNLYVSVNGGARYRITNQFDDGVTRRISFNPETNVITVNSNTRIKFTPEFTSPYVNFDMVLGGIRGDASVRVMRLNNQAFSGNNHRDNASPTAYLRKENGLKRPGTVVTVYAPVMGDVLSPVLKSDVKLIVTKGGQFVTSTDGVRLDGTQDNSRDYKVDLGSERATYSVSLTAKDTMCKTAYNESYEITVVDVEAPVITMTDGYKSNTLIRVKPNTVIDVNYTVTDNYTSEANIVSMVHLYKAADRGLLVDVGNKIKFTEAGEYIVYVYAYDEAGNCAVASFHVEVVA